MYIRICNDFSRDVCHHDEQTGEDRVINVVFQTDQVFLVECVDLQEDWAAFRVPAVGVVTMADEDWEEYEGRVMFSMKGWTAIAG